MNLPPSAKEVASWLDVSLSRDTFCEIWLFGSFMTAKEYPRDVDVLGVFEESKMYSARCQRAAARSKFKRKFGLPLHLALLTTVEVREVQDSVNKILGCGYRVR